MRRLAIAIVCAAPIACSPAVPTPEPQAPPPAAPAPMAPSAVVAAPPAPPSAPSPAPAASAPPPEIPKGTAVLHIGDSFALAGFAQALRPKMKALGVRYEVRTETSSFTTTWSAKMDRLVSDMQPDLVLITLGANEVANVDPAAHAPAIRRIVTSIGGRPCVWISPPSWRKDTGIIEVIRQHSAPCRFFDSDRLVTQPIARQADKIHPNEQGGAVWADAFWGWLQEQRAPAGTPAPEIKGKKSPWLLKAAPPEEHLTASR